MAEKYKTSKEILSDLEKISPLEISNYLIKCEFYDESDALETLWYFRKLVVSEK